MKITRLSFLFSIITLAIISVLISIAYILLNLEKKQFTINNNRFVSRQLSDELLQSSDDLTRMARTYVNTGDTLYKKYYFAILDIRNGKIPRPKNYSNAYWYIGSGDNVGESLIPVDGDTISLRKLMLRAGIHEDELALLISAESKSNTLVNLELEAFAALEGFYADNSGNFAIKKTPDAAYARSLLYSTAYHDAKVGIMKPIIQFQNAVDARTKAESVGVSKMRRFWINTSLVVGLIGLFLLVVIGFSVQRIILGPINMLLAQIKSMSKGNYTWRNSIHSNNELQTLGESFNKMAGRIQNWDATLREEVEKQTAELVKLNKSLKQEIEKSNLIEAELIAAKEKAEENEQRLLESQRVAKIGHYSLDLKKGLFTTSPEIDSIFGIDESFVKDMNLWMTCIHPDDREALMQYMQKDVLSDHNPHDLEYRIYNQKTGELVWIHHKGQLRYDSNNNPVELFGTGQDITDRKGMENQIRKMNVSLEKRIKIRTAELAEANKSLLEKIEEQKRTELELIKAKNEADDANRSKSEFLSRMSHELRTPMNSILGFAQLLELDQLNIRQTKNVEYIIKSGRHLLALINEVLDITRIESGSLTISLEPVDVSSVVGEVVETVSPLAYDKNVNINFIKPASSDNYILADLQRIKQILINLLSNAIKYNRVNGKVEISTILIDGDIPEEQMMKIAVTDSGDGISEENINLLFNPFERIGANEKQIEGTGLGLSVVKKLVDVMGGKLGVDSKLGEGSTFWVAFKRSEGPKPADMDMGDINQGSESAKIQGTLLYIEDNQSNIDLVEEIISMQRPEIKLVIESQGLKTLELAKEIRPNLILLDLNLPDTHGSEVLNSLLKDKETADIPVVVLSADAMPKQVKRLLGAGARDYLTKPIVIKDFLKILDEHL